MKTLEKYTEIFKALGEPSRVRILKMLQLRMLCVCEITDVLGLKSSTVSEHLSILKENGLISSQKQGKIVYYKLNFFPENPSVTVLNSIILCSMEDDPVIKSDKEKAKKVDCREILARKS